MKRTAILIALVTILGLGAGVAATSWWSAAHRDVAKVQDAPALPVPRVSAPATAATASPLPIPEGPSVNRPDHSLDDPESPWVVVNKVRPLRPVEYVPENLTALAGVPGGANQRMTAEAAADFLALYEALSDEGLPLRVGTAYRSYNFQSGIFADYLQVWGREHTETLVARPGHSEHQSGYAVDVHTTAACRLKPCFADSDTYAWLRANAADYGFIERYPEGFEEITGYSFEPWHWRWVGQDLALELRAAPERTLEEFFGLPPAPDYRD